MRYFLLLVLFISSCGTPSVRPINPTDPLAPIPIHTFKVKYDKAFEEYVSDFEDDWGLDIKDLVIEFGEIKQNDDTSTVTLGICKRRNNTTPNIVIDPTTWPNLAETRKKLLIYHEIGHCVLHRAHIKGTNTSIMNPILINSTVFEDDEGFFIDELFDETKYGDWGVETPSLCRHSRGA